MPGPPHLLPRFCEQHQSISRSARDGVGRRQLTAWPWSHTGRPPPLAPSRCRTLAPPAPKPTAFGSTLDGRQHFKGWSGHQTDQRVEWSLKDGRHSLLSLIMKCPFSLAQIRTRRVERCTNPCSRDISLSVYMCVGGGVLFEDNPLLNDVSSDVATGGRGAGTSGGSAK